MNRIRFDLQRFATPSAKNLYLGAGQLFFDRFDNSGKRTGLRHLGNVPKFDLKNEVDKVQKKSSMNAARSIYAEAIKEIKSTADITLEEFDPANVALCLLGEEGVITQTAGSVTGERHTAYKGRYIQLNAYNVSNATMKRLSAAPAIVGAATPDGPVTSDGTVTTSGTYTGTTTEDYYIQITTAPTTAGTITGCKFKWKKGVGGTFGSDVTATGSAQSIDLGLQVALTVSAGQTFVVGDTWKISVVPTTTDYAPGTDFKTDPVLLRGGMILIPDTSSVVDGDQVLVSYTKAAGALPKVAAAAVGNIEGYLMFVGDPSKGPVWNAEFWHVSITPSGALPMIGEDFAGVDMSITVLEDRENHPDEPYYRTIQLRG